MVVFNICSLEWNIAQIFQALPKYKKLFTPVILKLFAALEPNQNEL
jgi:hypothetical protein